MARADHEQKDRHDMNAMPASIEVTTPSEKPGPPSEKPRATDREIAERITAGDQRLARRGGQTAATASRRGWLGRDGAPFMGRPVGALRA